jgi:hypothetical protein
MKRMRIGALVSAIAVVVLAGACSSLIPPIAVDNLFGIDGVVVDLAAEGAEVGALALPNGTSFEGTVSGTVTSEGFNLPAFVNASLMEESVLIGADVDVKVEGEDATGLLGDFSLVTGEIALEVRVDGIIIATASGAAAFSPPLVVTRDACTFSVDTTCDYTATVVAADHAIVVSASAEDASAVFEALQNGDTLVISGTYGVTLASPGLTESAIVSVTLKTAGGKIGF